ncbi:amino acid adenylation domain-containing protein [Streptomyces sp. NPDC018347]|uniref:amino acid adenylation domain-containing protein n=1 Tax=Streptomyces sp. NPDC018347 TaxID=3157193 RepID=UPI0033BFBA88
MTTEHTRPAGPWIVGRTAPGDPDVVLYCFPHSGGLVGEYIRLGRELPGVQVYGISLPGRGGRAAEPGLTDIGELVTALLDDTRFSGPFAFFGHSLGALVAFEVARELRARGRELPTRLILSAYPAPHLPRAFPGLSSLPDHELTGAVHDRHGGIPAEIAADDSLMELLLPALRTDFAILENYRYRPDEPLPVPLEVLGSDQDTVTAGQLAPWSRHSTAGTRTHRFTGGHFYFREDPAALTATLRSVLTPDRPTDAAEGHRRPARTGPDTSPAKESSTMDAPDRSLAELVEAAESDERVSHAPDDGRHACDGPVRSDAPARAASPQEAVLPEAEPPSPRTLLDIFRATVAEHPARHAIDDGTSVLSYASLAAEAEAGAERLRTHGIGVGDRVGVRIPSGTAHLYVAILAVLASGAAYVPVDADDPDGRAERVWSEAGACAVFEAGGALRLRDGVPARSVTGTATPDDDAWVMFTSGTSGRPKGVAVTHRAAAAFVDAEELLFARSGLVDSGDRVLAGLSVAFDASCEEMWLAWRNGACLVPAPRVLVRAGAEICPWLVERRVTVVSTVPSLVELWPAQAFAGIRLLVLGGEACPPELAHRLADHVDQVWNTYGPTEATVASCAARLTPADTVRIGLPLAGWRLAVLDGDSRPVRWGEVGELVIGGVGLGRYLDAAVDAERFAPLPGLGWPRAYRTGDLVRAERSGLVFLGRADEQVKIRGHRIEPAEISSLLAAHPAVGQAYVRAVDDGDGPYLVAYAVTGEENIAELRGYLAERLPAAMRPAVIVPMTSLPLATSGKLDPRALPAPAFRAPENLAPDSPKTTQEIVSHAWRSVLKAEHVGTDDNFFDVGGHSMLLVQLRRRLADSLDLSIPVVELFAHPTVRGMATYLEGLRAGA